MATGFDALIDSLLSSIALCGVQGAGSADFYRFIQAFYQQSHTDESSQSRENSAFGFPPEGLGRIFHERVWHWVSNHPDIRITYKNEVRTYTLSEFETAELQGPGTTGPNVITTCSQPPDTPSKGTTQPSKTLSAMRGALRERLTEEKYGTENAFALTSKASASTPLRQLPRNIHQRVRIAAPIFDEPEPTITAPRLYASQNRIWQALTGHGIDLKKVPSMEFVLLSLIAARGADGITQPDLRQISGQDKRSVPHRTNELARKGYIVKNPVHAGKIRTSLCVHTKFVSQSHFFSSDAVEDVFQKGTFVLSSFVHLLYSKLKDAGIVPTRDIRRKLGVPITTWNKRASQGALVRLDQTGMIKRFRVRKKHSQDPWATCIRILREPRDEDVSNLGFRRQPSAIDETIDELLDEDFDGDTLMRDLEVDMLDDAEDELEDHADFRHGIEDPGRIPPQWTPDRFLANIIFDFVALGGANGCDSEMLRDRIMGPFWRRPMESYTTRLTDDWKKTQPLPLRHLAIIRDSRNTHEKKFIHYVYRTYKNFQEAVEAGEVHWEGVSKPTPNGTTTQKHDQPNKNATDNLALDAWGFQDLNPKDLVRSNGSATLSEVRSAIVHPRKYGPRWDNALTQEIGYQKSDTPITKKVSRDPIVLEQGDEDDVAISTRVFKVSKSKRVVPNLSLTPGQRALLGLKPHGRLSNSAEKQILAHRARTGDPTSLPDKIDKQRSQGGRQPLMTMEERVAEGLPTKGRLGITLENKIREERGLAKLPKKSKKRERKTIKEPALLTKEQRLSFGWKGHGRLPQDLMDGLRQEREDGIPLEESGVLPKYMNVLKAKAAASAISEPLNSVEDGPVSTKEHPSPSTSQHDLDHVLQPSEMRIEAQALPLPTVLGKRRADTTITSSQYPKKQRTGTNLSQKDSVATGSLRSPTSPDDTVSQVVALYETPNGPPLGVIDEERIEAATPTHAAKHSQMPTHSPPASAEKGIATSVQAQKSSALPGKKRAKVAISPSPSSRWLQPDASSLSPQAQAIYGFYTARSTPGLYLNPFARQKIARGRPRKAFIATFRLPRLKESQWFVLAPDDLKDTPRNTSAEVPVASNSNDKQAEGNSSSQYALWKDVDSGDRSFPVGPDSALLEPAWPLPIEDRSVEEQVNFTSQAVSTSPESETLPIATAESTDQRQEPSQSGAQDQNHLTEHGQTPGVTKEQLQNEQPFVQQSPSLIFDGVSEVSAEHVLRDPSPMLPRAVGWTAVNAPSPYPSPYAPSPCSDPTPPPQSANDATATNASIASESIPPAPVVDVDGSPLLFQGVCSAISEIHAPPLPEPKPRSKKTSNTEGSGLHFRRNIIREIIDLCHGVFPDSGEIGRPFHTLWVMRHGHVKGLREPIASTVNTTMRNMCDNPKFGLKRMVFLVKNKKGPFNSQKELITYTHLTPRSPEVLQLAHNIANFSLEKSHQYFPEEIRHLIDDTSLYTPLPVAPKDESIVLNQGNPKLKAQIKRAQKRQQSEMVRRKRPEGKTREERNTQVAKAPSKEDVEPDNAPRAKRTRLASLNDKPKRYRRAPPQQATAEIIREESEAHGTRDLSSPETDSSEDTPLVWKRPLVAPLVDRGIVDGGEDGELSPEAEEIGAPEQTRVIPASLYDQLSSAAMNDQLYSFKKGKAKKRVRVVDPAERSPRKKARINYADAVGAQDVDYLPSSSAESDTSSPSEAEVEEETDEEDVRPSMKKKRRAFGKRQRGKPGPLPTLLERLTGLTGDPNDPIYQPPLRKQRVGSQARPWSERKKTQTNKQKKERKYAEVLDPVDKFKKFCCTLIIASSMSGEEGTVDWGIVEKVYSSDKLFDVMKTKKLWDWIQTNMATQLSELTTTFQVSFLNAYEDGEVASIEDPETYDWTSLVSWAMRKCEYPEVPLPIHREVLRQFVVDESSYEALDRAKWYKEKMADRTRTQLQLQHPFTTPLYRSRQSAWSPDDKVLKARSWVRANTTTPQALYDANQAHEKLMVLGETLFVSVVGDYVQKQKLRLRKLKRLLPGRNYSFTKAFAKKFVRPFELGDFMAAVKVKKDMDSAFANEDPEKRFYNISRSEEDGCVTAILTMVSEGKIKLLPQLPSVNHEFGAPLPRLSVWGFCEGDYIHRSIDRNRLLWDIHVVPTARYQFGNPLQPSPFPLAPTDTGEPAEWPALPEPPLPGKHDPNALLPIWSSIDGQSVTWPWWYRILNLVLQPLIFQPGVAAADIHSHCPEHTTEVFEIELVLSWLESVNAVSKTAGGGYVASSDFWAAFGDKLLDTQDDWFGEHVKRKAKNHAKQLWREEYNLRHSTLQIRNGLRISDDSAEEEEEEGAQTHKASSVELSATERILKHPRRQYRITQQAFNAQQPQDEKETSTPPAALSLTVIQAQTESSASASQTPELGRDAEMADVSANGEDVDAEGEVDDAMY